MPETYFVVTWAGPFGFLKPWMAVRDAEVYSQTFLTPSVTEGMRQKLEVSAILRHRLHHLGVSPQQEQTQSAGWEEKTVERKPARRVRFTRSTGILTRGVLLTPTLHLAFPSVEDAERAAEQHLCLCRNEDVVLPTGLPREMKTGAFDQLAGFEFVPGGGPDAILAGYSRFHVDEAGQPAPMVGSVRVVGDVGSPSGR